MPIKRVLIVEDNEDNRHIYETILRHHGYDVLTAADGQDGLDAALREAPDLVLLDISLPGLSGWEIAEHLSAEQHTRDMVLVAVTAHACLEDRERARLLGFRSYMTKPVEPRRVVEEVRRFIGPALPLAEPASPILSN
ncbi:MAG: response regulator [Longimicrobiales bacterium]